jgi:hypothetical protein
VTFAFPKNLVGWTRGRVLDAESRRSGDLAERTFLHLARGGLPRQSHARFEGRSHERKTFPEGASLGPETDAAAGRLAGPGNAGDLVAGSFSEASCNAMIGWSLQGQGRPNARRRSALRKADLLIRRRLPTCPTSASESVRGLRVFGKCERYAHECVRHKLLPVTSRDRGLGPPDAAPWRR